ncbi:predicted protein [Naegleria gruberi]|uniref:Predicted protein n=1 Tax=Naegleria gruberi TaxID=5762 RepID=D2W6L9_NAEGR|nr:uncharacterized protein NAEGRDRAFT_77063 [Naegleria gruberi]EFC35283.1 predicted protein [Naegleria gruberi]|eukprot:XP_002668027.1 predicted protein [Naegleria gruberi strain NEG-M]
MVFSSERGFLDSVDFCIFAGDNIYEMEKNIQLGQLTLEGIELTEKGKSQIEVSFELSDSFILNVTATDLTTKEKSEKLISLEKLESNRELTNKLEQDASKDGEEKEIRKLLHTYNSPSVLHEEL